MGSILLAGLQYSLSLRSPKSLEAALVITKFNHCFSQNTTNIKYLNTILFNFSLVWRGPATVIQKLTPSYDYSSVPSMCLCGMKKCQFSPCWLQILMAKCSFHESQSFTNRTRFKFISMSNTLPPVDYISSKIGRSFVKMKLKKSKNPQDIELSLADNDINELAHLLLEDIAKM